MQQKIFIKPAKEGAVVRDPITGIPLEAAGEWKDLTPYWRRRKNDNDVVETEPPKKEKTATTSPKNTVDTTAKAEGENK